VSVLDSAGNALPCQIEPAPRGRVVVAQAALPPSGEMVLRIESSPLPPTPPGRADGFSNKWYQASWDAARGIHGLVELATGHDWLGGAQAGLGSPIYQVFPGGNRGAAAGFGYTARTIPRDEITPGRCTGIRCVQSGAVSERWEFTYEVPGTTGYILAATFHRGLPHIELAARVVKTDVTDPEGLYVAFPVGIDGGIWHLDKPGAPIRPGLDQLPGACCDYYCLQDGAGLVGRSGGLAWTTLDAPLVHVGKLRLWDYATSIEPTGPLYSWLTNNKWETNFKLTCGGRYEFRYLLEFGPGFADPAEALAACRAHAMPPVVVRH
jgi:hypothetical protein